MQLTPGPFGVQVHQDPNGPRLAAGDLELARTQQRDVTETERPGCRRGELRMEIVRSGENDAHQVFVIDLVAVEHLRDERFGLGIDLFDGVDVARGCAAKASEFHGGRGYPVPSPGPGSFSAGSG